MSERRIQSDLGILRDALREYAARETGYIYSIETAVLRAAADALDACWQEIEHPFDQVEYDRMFERMTKAEAELADARSGFRYIEQRYGRLDGVGWDRVLP